MDIIENLSNRKWLASKLRAEIIGPDPSGTRLAANTQHFTWEEFRQPKKQENGEEILWQDSPAKRYGAGILYPIGVVEEVEQVRTEVDIERISNDAFNTINTQDDVVEKQNTNGVGGVNEDLDDYDVTLANAFKPSALGLSFLADFSIELSGFTVDVVNVGRLSNDEFQEIPSATYRKNKVFVGDSANSQPNNALWFRYPLLDSFGNYPRVEFLKDELLSTKFPLRKKIIINNIPLEIVVVVRGGYSRITSDQRLITVTLLNCHNADEGKIDEMCLFQSGIKIKGSSNNEWIASYPETEVNLKNSSDPLSDENRNELLYRQQQVFAIGHGCAVDWKGQTPEKVSEVWTDVLPTYETSTTSADLFVINENGVKQPLKVSMRKLAGLDPFDDGFQELELLVDEYSKWISSLKKDRKDIPPVQEHLKQTASELINKCEECRDRIIEGINLLKVNSEFSRFVIDAFKLTNHAMLIAQLRSTRDIRKPSMSIDGHKILWTPEIVNPDPKAVSNKGYWRAFQIAFLLMSLKGIVEPDSKDRDTVDLIWFPTGGGKTEAYLGLTAFTIIFNRLSGNNSGGADVLMRYTLRLLTAQQFQRASLLFCALEHLRKLNVKLLGINQFRIGLWVGRSTTPNDRKTAVQALAELERNPDSINPFVLLKCPWCGSAFGPTNTEQPIGKGKYRKNNSVNTPSVYGYRRYKCADYETVVFRCGDTACEFGEKPFTSGTLPLPIVIIDEDLLEDPPNLVIGTVDKFAMLAWKPSIRSLFGVGENGLHVGAPPTLIIQDELHLISGPLGSMVGAYETIIERLCTDESAIGSKPKIIASTATISRADEQIKNLYARENVFLFPPSGLEAGDSFFAREDRDENGQLKPGRMYLGVLAPAHGSLQTTEARVFASLLQHAAIMLTSDEGKDPWWTLLCFFNSIRELGSAASLMVSDTRDYLRVILDRHGIKYDQIRKLFEVSELTSRIRSDQVPKELERLEKTFNSQGGASQDAVDACLASNIIEVGVDISRLALMAIVGQPKTTSQYIQVSSRVGRDPEKPGLVVVLYGQSKPRDRSHYERFRPYHQKLYAQVEPTSVTPFSPPAVERALHGIIVAAVRQLGNLHTVATKPYPFPIGDHTKLFQIIEDMIDERVLLIAPEEHASVMSKFKERLKEWQIWQPAEYGGFYDAPLDPPLIHPAGSSDQPTWERRSWPTVSSLRDVDASCEADVTSYFNQIRNEEV